MKHKLVVLLLLSIFSFSTENLNAQGWSPLGAGTNNNVIALTVYDGELIAGGLFITAGGIAAKRIARWNGVAWDSLAHGISGPITSLAAYNGELFAAGTFTVAGSLPMKNIARWNGTVWDSLGSGLNLSGYALAVYNGELYATGDFTIAGGIPALNIAKWNGTNWSALNGSGPNFTSEVLYVFNGLLYRQRAGYEIMSWDGTNWDSLGSGVNNAVFSMTEYNGELYVGGTFTIIGGLPVNLIAKWNGTQWSDVGGGMTGSFGKEVRALTVYNGELYAGGYFNTAGGVPVSNIAKWNGTTWSPVCSGLSGGGGVRALQVYNGELYAGGFFTTAGGTPTNRIAKWSPLSATTTPSGSAALCSGNPVTLTANSGHYSYQWYNNNILLPGETNPQLTVSSVGNYSVVTSTNAGACTATSSSVQVIVGTGPTNVTITSSTTVGCEPNTIYVGYGAQSINLTASATGAVSYLWSTGATTQSISVSTAGIYSVTAYDTNGCAAQSQITINVADARCGTDKRKINICHVPDGNPNNRQTICIAPSAVAAHLANHPGDCLGTCR